MNDTHPKMAEKMKALMREKSGAERLMMGFSMYASARSLVMASLLSRNEGRPADFKGALFLRFYGDDFDAETKKKLLENFNADRG